MRRLLAISLLLLFSFSLAAPVFSSGAAEANLPACCRRGGKHHCALMSADFSQGKNISTIAEKCPYTPTTPTAVHLSVFTPPVDDAVFAGLLSHPAVHAQTAAQYRISFDRSRQKRGPPSLSLL